LSEKLQINPSAVQKHIEKLKKEGMIERIGGDRGGHWEINNKEFQRLFPHTERIVSMLGNIGR
jgi:predicted ArsR family transcriptional regulator